MQDMKIKRVKSDGQSQPSVVLMEKNGVPYLSFPALEKLTCVKYVFSTRLGGASSGIFASMNFSFTRGDNEEAVMENYRRIASVMECTPEDIVCSHQTHTANIRMVTKEDAGKGLTKNRDYEDIDGLVTNEKGLCLALFFADCVPVYFVDPVKQVIGLAHSGWKGTVSKISENMIHIMKKEYDSDVNNIIVAIGPSICQECYEVSEDVAFSFMEAFPGALKDYKKSYPESNDRQVQDSILIHGKKEGKYQLNLWKAVERTLLENGIRKENITITDICTCCNPKLLFSHRASNGERGNLGAFLKLI